MAVPTKKTQTELRDSKKGVTLMRKMKCTNCGRRAFDISKLPKEQVYVKLKCPQCGKFVLVPCNEKSELQIS